MPEVLVEIKNLTKHFTVETNMFGHAVSKLKAVDDVSFKIYKGEAFGLVGESGCGKSTAGRTIIRLYDATEGEVLFEGKNILCQSHQ